MPLKTSEKICPLRQFSRIFEWMIIWRERLVGIMLIWLGGHSDFISSTCPRNVNVIELIRRSSDFFPTFLRLVNDVKCLGTYYKCCMTDGHADRITSTTDIMLFKPHPSSYYDGPFLFLWHRSRRGGQKDICNAFTSARLKLQATTVKWKSTERELANLQSESNIPPLHFQHAA